MALTNTPLPSLPDFDTTLSLAIGGGGGTCAQYQDGFPSPNFLEVNGGGKSLSVCFSLKGMDLNQSFKINVFQSGNPGDASLESPNLFLDLIQGSANAEGGFSYNVLAEGYKKNSPFGIWQTHSNGISTGYFTLWSPKRLSPGHWYFSISQQGSTFGFVRSDFQVESAIPPFIDALSSRPSTELEPFNFPAGGFHLVSPDENGKIDVVGMDFPFNTSIYVLLYLLNTDKPGLASKQVVQSNEYGSFNIKLSGPFESGQSYLLIGLSDPNTPLGTDGNHIFNWKSPHDFFDME